MASVVACAGDELKMGQGAFLMVHNPWTVTAGNAEELRKDADTLDKMRDSILSFYQSKAYGKTADDLKALMDAETWLTPDDARAAGFLVDDYAGELKAAASLTRRAFAKAPDAAKALVEFHDRKPEPPKNVNSDTSEVFANATTAKSAEGAPKNMPPENPSRTVEPGEASGAVAGATTVGVPTDNWEARFKGLSKRYNEAQAQALATAAALEKDYKAKLDALTAERDNLKTQLDQSAKDLADANAKVSELSAKVEEQTQALQKATDDLAQTRDSLKAAEDKAAKLESTRDLLTAGVLTPPAAGTSYAEQMQVAKTPAEREALRAKKRAGKIK
jgi:hypothetical protein